MDEVEVLVGEIARAGREAAALLIARYINPSDRQDAEDGLKRGVVRLDVRVRADLTEQADIDLDLVPTDGSPAFPLWRGRKPVRSR